MKTKHTPGPWELQEIETNHHGYDWRTYAVRSPQNVCLAVVGEVDRFESERIPANAKLIAAAPELLSALQAFLRAPSIGSSGPGSVTIEVQTFNFNAARAAIARATGAEG